MIPDPDSYIRTALGEYPIGELEHIASEWHSGQASAFYAFSSSGTITPGLAAEARECLKHCEDAYTADVLRAIASLEDLLPQEGPEEAERT